MVLVLLVAALVVALMLVTRIVFGGNTFTSTQVYSFLKTRLFTS